MSDERKQIEKAAEAYRHTSEHNCLTCQPCLVDFAIQQVNAALESAAISIEHEKRTLRVSGSEYGGLDRYLTVDVIRALKIEEKS